MPTILSHPAIPVALGLGLGRDVVSTRLLLAGAAASILPDLDVFILPAGTSHTGALGHRGASHSLLFAALVALLGASLCRWLHSSFGRAFWFLFVATASHGVLDAFTTGGAGIAFFWPVSDARYFAPIQVIEVSPLRLSRFLSARGAAVLVSEVFWVWLPSVAAGLGLAAIRARRRERGPS